MGNKKLLLLYHLKFSGVVGGIMTGTNSISSESTDIRNQDNVGLDISWTGTPVGTISVQCSVDNVTFRDLTFDPVLAQPAGSAGGYLVNLNQVPFIYVRVAYTNASGVGVLLANIVAKDVN